MHAAIDADVIGKGRRPGDERYMEELLKGLLDIDRSSRYTVYLRRWGATTDLAGRLKSAPQVRTRTLSPSSVWLGATLALPAALRADRPDLVHVQYFAPFWSSTKVVVTIHDLSFMTHPELFTSTEAALFRRIIPYSARKARAVITDTEHGAEVIASRLDIPREKVHAVPLAPARAFTPDESPGRTERIRLRYNLPRNFFLCVGTIQPRKNVLRLIKAFRILMAARSIDHHLVLAGSTKPGYHDVDRALTDPGLRGRVHALGFIPRKDLPDLYRAASVFVFPTLCEGFGLPLLEAMATGTPVVASQVSAVPEVTGDGALLVDPLDPTDMAEGMHRIAVDEGFRRALRERGLARAAQFDWSETARKTLAVYRTVANQP